MKISVFVFLFLIFSLSEHVLLDDYANYPMVFLNPTYNGIVQLVNDNKTVELHNNILEGDFILFSLIKKDDSRFDVIAWNSSDESFIAK